LEESVLSAFFRKLNFFVVSTTVFVVLNILIVSSFCAKAVVETKKKTIEILIIMF
jgi:hypothetical protein